MHADIGSSPVRRVVLVVLDGLRPDAIPRFHLHNVAGFARRGASTFRAQTVSPSITPCAMASLLTGAAPERHGVQSERFHLPRPRGPVHPLATELRRHSLSSSFFMPRVPFLMRGIASRISTLLGLGEFRNHGRDAHEVLDAARVALESNRPGLVAMHWLDADRAGHEFGWMSPEYLQAISNADRCVGHVLEACAQTGRPRNVLLLSDHGGHGRSHGTDCDEDMNIPWIMHGPNIKPGPIDPTLCLYDACPTLAHLLGVPRAREWDGRAAMEAILVDSSSPHAWPAEP